LATQAASPALVAAGTPTVAITLGRHGAVLADRTGCWHAHSAERRQGSAVGAGDAFLAALLLAHHHEPADRLARAVAAGAAALESAGAALLRSLDTEMIRQTVEVRRLTV
jgi:fructose-1-phosphate kinase PfkB-like protein